LKLSPSELSRPPENTSIFESQLERRTKRSGGKAKFRANLASQNLSRLPSEPVLARQSTKVGQI
jgi:hypothetical protein